MKVSWLSELHDPGRVPEILFPCNERDWRPLAKSRLEGSWAMPISRELRSRAVGIPAVHVTPVHGRETLHGS